MFVFVYVLNCEGKPLMPTSPAKARWLLKEGKAKVVRKTPFTIKLRFGSSEYKQEVVAGMDSGSAKVGTAAVANGKVMYQAEVTLRTDVSRKMEQRKAYRRTRRSRKTRYRQARFENRGASRRPGRLPPSIRSKVESHLRERRQVERLLPVTRWKVETASFDIHKLVNPEVTGVEYQNGPLKDWYHVKAYVLHRDGHQCQSGQKINHSLKLNVHHLQFKSRQGGNHHGNLLTLCLTCHQALHQGKFEIKPKRNVTKPATEAGIIASQLKVSGWEFEPTFGYETKYKREQFLKLPKSHTTDAIAICCEDGEVVEAGNGNVFVNRHVSNGDYQQTTGKHSQKRIPTSKLFGLRKFDLIQTVKGIGFITGKRSSGYFALGAIDGTRLTDSVNIKTNCVRLRARTTTLLQSRSSLSSRP
ncbi:MAG: RRXRR domain-containing protein [Acidobacteria bacterium]|nr:RRXRR domain-containing protein [Acidobacteriota bacterium]